MLKIALSQLAFCVFYVAGAVIQARQGDPGVGSTVTVAGVAYRLDSDVSSAGSNARTFQAHVVATPATIRFAKRPVNRLDPLQAFATEVANTRSASTVLAINLFFASGTDTTFNFPWLITNVIPGSAIEARWIGNPNAYRTRALCVAELNTARNLIATSQRTLGRNASTRFIHNDSHTGNWYVPLTGAITNPIPLDFGQVRSTAGMTDAQIDTLITTTLNTQYQINADTWAALTSAYNICRQ